MIRKPFFILALAAAAAFVSAPALAVPTLKANVVVTGDIVTAGDMFEDAGAAAGQGLFRSPAPGTAGGVSLEAVRKAAALVGIDAFHADDVTEVRVARSGVQVDQKMLTDLMRQDLLSRGILSDGMTVAVAFSAPLGDIEAAATEHPVRLIDLRYMPAGASFIARFQLAGRRDPLDLTGRLTMMVEAPHLAGTLAAGTILTKDDIAMSPEPAIQAQAAGLADPNQLIGKQLVRDARAGMLLRLTDVTEPKVVARNEPVTVYLHEGPMTLTMKGQALNAAAKGEAVAVLNTMSKKILHGTAVSPGAVEIGTEPINVAGL